MGLWPLSAVQRTNDVSRSAAANVSVTAGNVYELTPGALEWSSAWNTSPVSRADALSIPAVARGVDLIATTIASLPIQKIGPDGRRLPLDWLDQPEADRPRFYTITRTVKDLILDGRSYWRIKERQTDGTPRFGGCEYLNLDRVTTSKDQAGTVTVEIDGKPVQTRDVIGFHGWHDGIRRHGARIIRTAMALEEAAKRYADVPMPSIMLKNVSNYELSDAEIDALIADAKAARQSDAIGYTNAGIDPVAMGWDAAQLQLVEARQFTNAQIANLLGLPTGLIAGAGSSGSTLQYSSNIQDNRSLVDFGLTAPMKSIESRLSMSDMMGAAALDKLQVTPRGTVVRFDVNALLRGNPTERASIYAQLVPLGILTIDEARLIEDLTPIGVPNQ